DLSDPISSVLSGLFFPSGGSDSIRLFRVRFPAGGSASRNPLSLFLFGVPDFIRDSESEFPPPPGTRQRT
ncbi:hypothetical protein, partial [Streptomyces zhihengii]